jgi:hypothetical protein
MKLDTYVDRNGTEISEARWRELRADRSYSMIREYANNRFHIRAMWIGRLEFFYKNTAELDRKFKPFSLHVIENVGNEPKVRTQDCDETKLESELVNLYEDFLVRHNLGYWAPSELSGTTHFVETGNLLTGTKDAPALIGEAIHAETATW